MAAFLTIASPVDVEITIRRSRFIASLRRASSREEFDVELKNVQAALPKATHYCWAYRFASSQTIEHASDAGEPSGTAGRPILGVLKRHDLQNTAAIVTRYFGGIKLGVKGLIDAYSASAEQGVDAAEIIEDEARVTISFNASYDVYGIISNAVLTCGGGKAEINAEFAADITGVIKVKESALNVLLPILRELASSGRQFRMDDTDLSSST